MAEWQSGDLHANGLKIHYTRTGGSKPSLVLNHGATDDGLCYTPLARVLEADYDVVMPDARGHGLSDAPVEGYGTGERAADLAALIQGLGLRRPAVGGHSMGAGTTLRFAADYPEMLRCAVLEDPGFRLDETPMRPGRMREMVLQNRGKSRRELIEQMRKDRPEWSEDELGPWADSKLRVSMRFAEAPRSFPEKPDWRELLPKVTVPVLLITSDPERGGIVSPEAAELAKSLCPTLEVVRLSPAGHNVRREQFARFVEVVKSFLAQS